MPASCRHRRFRINRNLSRAKGQNRLVASRRPDPIVPVAALVADSFRIA